MRISIPSTRPVLAMVRGDSVAGVSRARQAARAFTDRLTPASRPDTADTLVLVSELATNALRHGGGSTRQPDRPPGQGLMVSWAASASGARRRTGRHWMARSTPATRSGMP